MTGVPWTLRLVRPVLVAAALVAATWLVALDPSVVAAASPSPTAIGVGDPRSSGQGPGLVGDPATAILVVLAIAALSVLLTVAWIRATGTDRRRPRS